MESTTNKGERRATAEEFERVARDYPQFAQSYAVTWNELISKEAELEKMRADKLLRDEESTTDGVRIVLNAVGILAALLPLALVVVLPLVEKIIYFYMGSLSFVGKEGLLTVVQTLVLLGIYRAYRFHVDKKIKR